MRKVHATLTSHAHTSVLTHTHTQPQLEYNAHACCNIQTNKPKNGIQRGGGWEVGELCGAYVWRQPTNIFADDAETDRKTTTKVTTTQGALLYERKSITKTTMRHASVIAFNYYCGCCWFCCTHRSFMARLLAIYVSL